MVNTALKFVNTPLTFGVYPKRDGPAASGFIYLKQYDRLSDSASKSSEISGNSPKFPENLGTSHALSPYSGPQPVNSWENIVI